MERKRLRKQQMEEAKERKRAINEARIANGDAPLEDSDDGFEIRDEDGAVRETQNIPKPRGRPKPKKLFAGVDPDEIDPLPPHVRQAFTHVFTQAYRAVELAEENIEGYCHYNLDLLAFILSCTWSCPIVKTMPITMRSSSTPSR